MDERKNIAEAIKNVMEEIHNIGKNTTVGTGSNSYKGTSEKDVKEAVRKSMIKNGLSILPTGVDSQYQIDRWEEEAKHYNSNDIYMKSKQSIFTEVKTTYILLHTSGESIEVCGYGHGVDTQDKGAGKATTYALKNTLLNMFLVPTGEDTDSTHSDDIPVPKKEKKWYNDVDKNLEAWRESVIQKKVTPQQILDKIKTDGYSLSRDNEQKIRDLF